MGKSETKKNEWGTRGCDHGAPKDVHKLKKKYEGSKV
jgi:hypothetical protein